MAKFIQYAVRLRQYIPAWDGTREYDQIFRAGGLEDARDLAQTTARDAALRAPQTICKIHIVTRDTTEWVELHEETAIPPASPAG